ncbi:MAG: ComF family protein [Fimbriimonadales bacterium]|nr:ComF family protein [Fimbriimonadales bacterium]
MLQWLLDGFYPRRCVGCGRFSREPFCTLCWDLLPRIKPPACERCGAPMGELPECTFCHGFVYRFDRAVCVGLYQGPLRHAIIHLKFRRWFRSVQSLSALVVETLLYPENALLREVDGLIPVPIHPLRRAMRGFNQAEEIAQAISAQLGIPMMSHLLRRRFYRRPQVGLTAAQRWENVQGAYEVVHPGRVQGCRVLLLDDVFTTGSTFDACADALKQAGASAVFALAIAREVDSSPHR